MFRTRRKRFEKLLALRQRELDQKQAEVSRALQAQRESKQAVDDAQEDLTRAAQGWRGEAGETRTADSYLEAGAWLQRQIQEVEKTINKYELASERVRLTQLGVQKAEQAKRQIETLLERLDREQASEEARIEQIDQDELAARLSMAKRRFHH